MQLMYTHKITTDEIFSASIVLVNSDCELKICDMGLSRGYDTKVREDEPNNLTEYVATRWYRGKFFVLLPLCVFRL